MTDSNSGITQSEAARLGVSVIPMPFFINEKLFYEDVSMTQEEFYQMLEDDSVQISTSMPAPEDVMKYWDELLETHEEVVYIPMSSGLSSSCSTARMLAEDAYEGKVFVVDNQRISGSMLHSVLDAKKLAEDGRTGEEIRNYLEETKRDNTIYITLDTLKYLKKGGRITPAAAAVGTLLQLKPVLQIQGEKLDAFAKARTWKKAKELMLEAVRHDIETRFMLKDHEEDAWIDVAYSGNPEEAEEWRQMVQEFFPKNEIGIYPLSLSVSCHIGKGALAIVSTKKMI